MAHESIVYGFIQGATFRREEYHKLQVTNLDVLRSLPDEDEYPYVTRGMFSAPEIEFTKGTFRAHIIHFGGSMNGLNFDEVPVWLAKLERLLQRLYWFEASAHILTDYIDGAYHFQWSIHRDILATYEAGTPMPTTKWIRTDVHSERLLLPNE